MQSWRGHAAAKEPSQRASWVDFFSLSQLRAPSRALGKLCSAPAGAAGAVGTVRLLPGVDILDLYATSVKAELWKDGQTSPCLVPRQLLGWEFYGLLWPQPGGASQLRLSLTIDLLIGRPPGGEVCPSLVFAHVPANHLHSGSAGNQPKKGDDQAARSPQSCERLRGNLDASGRTVMARLVVLCPSVYRDATQLPDELNWGLFIRPRSRSLVLLNKQRGRIDLPLAILVAIDSAFRLGRHFIDTVARLFEPFGCQSQVPTLLAGKFDPWKIHSGLTNALVVDHVNLSLDGREDYWRFFSVRLPTFFLSNASNNLRFFTPSEAQQLREGAHPGAAVPPNEQLPDLPAWTLSGPSTAEDLGVLRAYRERVPALPEPQDSSVGDGFLQLLGLDSARGGAWPFPSLGGCTEIAMGGADAATPLATSPVSWSASARAAGAAPGGRPGAGWAHEPAPDGQPAGAHEAVPRAPAAAGWTTTELPPGGNNAGGSGRDRSALLVGAAADRVGEGGLPRGPPASRRQWPGSGPPTPLPIEH